MKARTILAVVSVLALALLAGCLTGGAPADDGGNATVTVLDGDATTTSDATMMAGAVTTQGTTLPSEWTESTVTAVEGDRTLAVVNAQVADTAEERQQGLSGVKSLPDGTGMLFVFSGESERAFYMPDMYVALDMVFVGADGEITTIHSAPIPPEGTPDHELKHYRGDAKWVLEVPMGGADEHDVTAGDEVRIER